MEIKLFKYQPYNPFVRYSEEIITVVKVKTESKTMIVEGISERTFVSQSHAITAWIKQIHKMLVKDKWMVNDKHRTAVIESILRRLAKEKGIEEEEVEVLLQTKYAFSFELKPIKLIRANANQVESTEVKTKDRSGHSVQLWIEQIHDLLEQGWSIIASE